ncbi:MAG: RNA methyltransferase [Bacteroidales bacterium]|nr:RNA methyltransferase [Bacteroidales bacterium]
MRAETITSAQNPKFKHLLLLQEKSKARREQGLFVVEGRRELRHCLEAGYKVRTVFVCPEIADSSEVMDLLRMIKQATCHSEQAACHSERSEESSVMEIPEALYRKAAYRESTEGIIAEVEYKTLGLNDLHLPENPLVMVLESVEKPGNLGAALRSADAAKADAVFICDPLTDLYNPNLIRASIGAIFTVPTVAVSSEEAIAFLQAHDIQILTAQLQDSSLYYDVDMKRGTALVMGTESTGLTPLWRQAATAHIRIPMLGKLDSLNVSVSAAILLFEAVRQRQG